MPSFGRNPFPLRFGGGPSELEIEHMAMLDALRPGWDVSEETAVYAEAYAHALAITMIWRINGRLANQLIPSKMMESLPVWEAATSTRPRPDATAPARRRALAGKLRGLVGETIADISDACTSLAGANFVRLAVPDPSFVVSYQPGLCPGPPGYEWSSQNATLAAIVTPAGLDDVGFRDLIQRVYDQVQIMAPGWMTFGVGRDDGGFISDLGTIDVTFI